MPVARGEMASLVFQISVLSLALFVSFTSAGQTKESCIEQHPECAKDDVCGTDWVKMWDEFRDRSICWHNLREECQAYRDCLNETRFATPPLPEVSNITMPNDTSLVNSSYKTAKPSNTGCSCNKTSQPGIGSGAELKPSRIYEYLFYVVVGIIGLVAIGWLVQHYRKQINSKLTKMVSCLSKYLAKRNSDGEGGMELRCTDTDINEWDVTDQQRIYELCDRYVSNEPGYQEALRRSCEQLVHSLPEHSQDTSCDEDADPETGLLGVKREDVFLYALKTLIDHSRQNSSSQ